jgi:hypothetical protein
VANCASGEYINSTVITNGKCSSTCPTTAKILSSDGTSCVSSCPSGEYIDSTVISNGKCSSSCPSTAKILSSDGS